MKDPGEMTDDEHVAASYRYLRLAIVVVVLTLGASVAIERLVNGCQLGSISAYYYSPVHSVFIGALMTMGVVMIAIKGADALEDMFFNVAGVLAPIVALVPTKRPGNVCQEATVNVAADDLIKNNVPALAVGAAVAIGMALVVAYKQGKVQRAAPPRATAVGLGLSVVMLIAGTAWYGLGDDSFRRWAHGTTAITMFVFIWMAVMVNAGWPRWLLTRIYKTLRTPIPKLLTDPTNRHLRYRTWYRVICVFMPVAGGLVLIAVPKSVKVFWLEVVEIIPFAAFWSLQTFEAWETGLTKSAPSD